MKSLLYILIWSALCFPILELHGKSISYYSVEDGLSQTAITCMYLDTRGFLWVGTQDGLNRYDGYNFLTFKNQPVDSNSITNNYIRCLVEDLNGNIWIGTNKGINVFLRNKGWFKHIVSAGDNDFSLYSDQIHSIKLDSKGKIWVKTSCSIEEFDMSFQLLRHELYKPLHDVGINWESYDNSLQITSNKIYVAEDCKLFVYNTSLKLLREREFKKLNSPIKSIYPDKNNVFWFVTNEGLSLFDSNSDVLKKYSTVIGSKYIDFSGAGYLYQDVNSDIWISTYDNVFIYSKSDNTIREIFNKEDKDYLPKGIKSILIDNARNLWIGAQSGLYKIDLKPDKFSIINKNSMPSLSGNNITAVFNDGERLWLGTQGNGLNIINLRTNENVAYKPNRNKISNISGNNIYAIKRDVTGNIWIGTEEGVDYVSRNNASYDVPVLIFNKFKREILNTKVYSIFSGSDSLVWFCLSDGIYSYNLANDEFNSLLDEKDSLLINNLPAYCGEEIDKNEIWFGTGNGILIYDALKKKLQLKNNANSPSGFLSNEEVLSMHKDSKNRIWVGTASGLNLWNPYSKSFIYYVEKDGLPNNLIYNIVEDRKGRLWISTNRGISELNTETETFISYDVNKNIQDFTFNMNTGCLDETGTIFFGGNKGVNYFVPDSIKGDAFITPIQVSTVRIFYKNGFREEIYSEIDKIEMTKQVSMIQFEFALLDYTESRKNRYSFKLEKANGHTLKWIDIGYKRDVLLANLEPGEYVLNVRAANNFGNWTSNSRSINITVYNPFWKTKEAIVFYVILALIILYYLYLYRTRTLRKLNKEYKERERINKQIAIQKEQLAIKNKNITDSINYAKRIQEAMMPPISLFEKLVGDSFVLYKPKDIVSGDFYWINERNNKVYLAAVDCTGHGVPGAFMSIIGFELFKRITSIKGVEEPAQILNILNESFRDIFRDVDNFTLRDGMDIAFCVLDKKNMVLEFAGAFNPLYLIRDNKLSEIKGDRFSVGLDDNNLGNEQSFTNHSISLEKDDIVYIFSDGYADQFGGPETKKFKYRRFRHLLLTIHKLPMESQRNLLEKTIEEWRGELDQVDDILLIGFRI